MENDEITLAMCHARYIYEGACLLDNSCSIESRRGINSSPYRLLGALYGSTHLAVVSIELGLKAWSKSEVKKYKRHHDLSDLFSQLSNPNQEVINSTYQQIRRARGIPEYKKSQHISEVLDDNKNVFVDSRYIWLEPPKKGDTLNVPADMGDAILAAEAILKAYDKWPPDAWEHPLG